MVVGGSTYSFLCDWEDYFGILFSRIVFGFLLLFCPGLILVYLCFSIEDDNDIYWKYQTKGVFDVEISGRINVQENCLFKWLDV